MEEQLVPLREVELTLSANFVSQLLVGIGGGLIITNLVGGSLSLIVASGLYLQFVLRKIKNWKSRRYPLQVSSQDSTSPGSSLDFAFETTDRERREDEASKD